MPTIVIEHVECQACKGTGLYKGFAERGGAAVVCHNCKGTGEVTFTYQYEEFTGRKDIDNVTRVFQGSFGYGLSDSDVTCKDGRVLHYSQYGCTYEDWKNGVVPTHMKELYCPCQAYNNGIGNEPLDRCRESNHWGSLISDCPNHADKMRCWRMFEENQTK
jgi:hypothetical protein